MKYIVAEGASFVAGGFSYGPGDEIDSDLFPSEALKKALQTSERFPQGKLIDRAKVSEKPNQPKEDKNFLDRKLGSKEKHQARGAHPRTDSAPGEIKPS